jgi:hypothetical protein
MNDSQAFHLTQIYEKLINDEASSAEILELEQAIMNDPQALELYQNLTFQHSYLRDTKGRDSIVSPQVRRSNQLKSTITSIVAFSAVAAAIIMGVILFSQSNESNQPENQLASTNENQPTHATISSSSLAQWGRCTLPTTLNKRLEPGSLELLNGTATLTFDSGAMVTLEAPAEIEIISEMKAIVKRGRVVAEVPESAIGFRLDTPDMEVTDLGTVFAVTVDHERGESQVDVIAGEVEIYHAASQNRKLLLDKQRVVSDIDTNSLAYSNYNEITRPDTTLDQHQTSVQTISTAYGRGGHASIISDHAATHLYPHLLQAKHSKDGSYSRKFYLQFDLSKLANKEFDKASLKLTQVISPYGFASFVPDCEFNVYALNNEAHEDWNPRTIDWKNAPANVIRSGSLLSDSEAAMIGTFSIPKGQQEGTCIIESEELGQLVKQDTNGIITLVITRKTKENHSQGLVHTFAGNNTKNATPPELIFITEK